MHSIAFNGEKNPIASAKDEKWKIVEIYPNAIALDYCDCYFDGICAGENLHINDIQQMACNFRRAVDVRLVFKFSVNNLDFGQASLVLETPERFDKHT